ncbi:MAG: lysine--tRNA ligase [Actinobacteria bacterium]|nr:lysine--tRNA ligase [Actinomycetota bacterium]
MSTDDTTPPPTSAADRLGGADGTEAESPAGERDRRLAKIDALRAAGVEPYPVRFDRTHTAAEVLEHWGHLESGVEVGDVVRVAGRVVLLRRQGKLTFATLRDGSGTIQLFVSRGELGEEAHSAFDDLDLGDWVGAEGAVMKTRRGELSVKVTGWTLLSKAVRPPPDKWHGLSDTDTRFRQRYVDLIANEEARRIFAVRFSVISTIRRFLDARRYVEVETPVLHVQAGGAAARPFETHHHALDMPLSLRIALELHLKRLVVGGIERVYEIGRVFRNEGLSTRHNPEFTMLECYEAFSDYTDMMTLTEEVVAECARVATGDTVVEVDGVRVDLTPPWPRRTMIDLIEEHTGARVHPSMPLAELEAAADRAEVPREAGWGPGKLVLELYEKTVEPNLVGPIFVLDYPREVSPLARAHRDDPALVERFEAVVLGRELANAFSELNDPIDQRQRFEAQAALAAAGDEEAHGVDDDYVRALEYGLPPCGGLGIGVDRLVMLIAGVHSIREVILFPHLRPEFGDEDF